MHLQVPCYTLSLANPSYDTRMKMQLESSEQRLISAYGPGSIAVDGIAYTDPILVLPKRVLPGWFQPADGDDPLATLTLEHFEAVINPDDGEERVEICLLGTGEHHRFAATPLMAELASVGIALEAMHTRAACRTYSVLVNEGRPVAAALLQI